MIVWAAVVLIVALTGTIVNLTMSIPPQLVLHDILLFLVTLGMLVRLKWAGAKPGANMTLWAAIVLFLAYTGTMLNLIFNTPPKLVLHDILLFLIALGVLVRIKFETKDGENKESQ